MKRAYFLLFLLPILLFLLTGCAAEAKEPMPEWPERLTGEYDAALTFTFNSEAPEAAGVDSQSGRMTALFPTESGWLALNWRRLMSGEVELLEDFLAGTGAETGVWEQSTDPYTTLESYVRLNGAWYCLGVACGDMEESALLRLVDGTVEAAAGKDTARPSASSALWLETLPWEKDWTCLVLGFRELEPEAGKETLRSLLYSYEWELADPAAEEAEFHPSIGRSTVPLIYQTNIYTDEVQTRETVPVRFHLRTEGEVTLYWNGALRRPLGEGAGEALLAAWIELSRNGVDVNAPPRLTLVSGEESIDVILHGTYHWSHVTRIGGGTGAESDADSYTETDWLGLEAPLLSAEGPVRLDFGPVRLDGSPGVPDRLSLTVFSGEDSTPMALEDGRFTPLAGLRTYRLSCVWNHRIPEEPGGSGSCSYILLIDGSEDLPPEPPEG